MKLYPAIISKNTDNPPVNYTEWDYVKVRIPEFHGPKTKDAYNLLPAGTDISENAKVYVEDSGLPWARIQRSLDNKSFSAQDFQEDDIVYVILENDSDKLPIITGFASTVFYTEDKSVAENNLKSGPSGSNIGSSGGSGFNYNYSSESGWTSTLASNIANRAIDEYNDFNKTKDSNKYNRWYGNPNGTAWCCAFVNYVFYECGAKQFFGEKTAYCPTLWNRFSDDQKISTGFDKGDIIFFKWDGNLPDHVGIVVEKQANGSNEVKTVEGNTSSASQANGNAVGYKTRKFTDDFKIMGAITFRKPSLTGSNDVQVFKYLVQQKYELLFGRQAACGILANILKESNCNPTAVGDSGTSYGICQWHDTRHGNGRMTNLKNYCTNNNLDYTCLFGQLEFLKHELITNYQSMVDELKNLSGTDEQKVKNAADIWCKTFERPANKETVSKQRQTYAWEIWPTYKNII